MAAKRESTALSPPARTYYESAVKIPGFDAPPDRCRNYWPVGFCEHGHIELGRSSCGTRYCEDHWGDWARGSTARIVRRCAEYRELQPDGPQRRLVHLAVSPPQDRRWSVRELYAARSDAYDAAAAAGARGGVTITHPYRTSGLADELWDAALEAGEVPDDTGKWAWLREQADDWEQMERLIEASPHYHMLAAASDIDGSQAPEGWVVENVRSFSRWDRQDADAYGDMAATAYYCLTHAAVAGQRATVTHWGELHGSVTDELTVAAADRIQIETERVGERQTEQDAERVCAVEDCEAALLEAEALREFLADEQAVDRLRLRRGGFDRWLQLRGMLALNDGMTDRPPPSASTSERAFLEWLEDRGRVLTALPMQASLPGVGPA